MAKQRVIIANLIDWSQSFVDENGSFYCGTTPEQKENAAKVAELADLVINAVDLHPVTAPEHKVNGGLYPVHNAVRPERHGPGFVYMLGPDGEELRLEDRTLSPMLTGTIDDALTARERGIFAPRGVYFQGESAEPVFTPEDVEATFGERIIGADEFLNGDVSYIIAPKQYFDATRVDNSYTMPSDEVEGIPNDPANVFSLLKARFPSDQYELVHVNTGVVEGICRLHTSTGLRQMFPFDRIINISDATTPLYGIGLGYDTPQESRDAATRVCKDIGIEYMTTTDFLAEFGGAE